MGTGTAARRWKLPKALLCYYSSYFVGACRSGCKEALTGQFHLSEDDPEIFALFVEWLCAADTETSAYTPHVPGAFELGRWHSDPELGWMLADRLLCPSFEKFALAYEEAVDTQRIYFSAQRIHHCFLRWMRYYLEARNG